MSYLDSKNLERIAEALENIAALLQENVKLGGALNIADLTRAVTQKKASY